MKKLTSEKMGWLLSGILGVVAFFIIIFDEGKKKAPCPTLEIKDSSIICLGTDCDTVNIYYYNECSDCITYEKDSATIFICGRFTTRNIPEITVKSK